MRWQVQLVRQRQGAWKKRRRTTVVEEKGSGGALVQRWKMALGLDGYEIVVERISLFQVSDGYCRVGNSLVGVCAHHDRKSACIYHTRRLTEDDVVHELLHVRHPGWSEEEVNREARRLLAAAPGAIKTL